MIPHCHAIVILFYKGCEIVCIPKLIFPDISNQLIKDRLDLMGFG